MDTVHSRALLAEFVPLALSLLAGRPILRVDFCRNVRFHHGDGAPGYCLFVFGSFRPFMTCVSSLTACVFSIDRSPPCVFSIDLFSL